MKNEVYRFGFWSAMLAFLATAGFVVVQGLQLVRLLPYPFDEILIYGFSLCIVVPFLLAMLALHYITPAQKKIWSHAALIFTVIYAVFVTANYVVQLATVIPFTLAGKANEIELLIQTPHSLFWNFDAIGYIFMGLAALFAVPALPKQGFGKWVRLSFLAHASVTPLISIVYFYPVFSEKLLLLGLPWAITAPLFMLMMATHFRKKHSQNPGAYQLNSDKIILSDVPNPN